MATEIGKGVIPVTFDKNQIGRDLGSSIEHGARASEGSITSTFKRLAGLATAAFAGVEVFGFFKDSVDAARESNKVAAQSEAVIKSTGGAAGVTAKQFGDLATAISLKTGVDDEQIQSAENLIATFTNIKNTVGDGNDIFNQATQTAVDMGAALGGDASSNAILLGKALNDPIRGLTALTRVGVTFTDEQRDQIKALQESGDTMGAQKIILGELNKEFGGSAEATATAGAKWGVFFGNIQEKIGNFLIPTLDSLATWAMDTLPNAFGVLQDTLGPVIESVIANVTLFWNALTTGFTEDEGTGIEKFALMVRDVAPQIMAVFQSVVDWITVNWPTISATITDVMNAVQTVITGVLDAVQVLWDNFGDNIMDFVNAVWPWVAQLISGVMETIQGVINFVLAVIQGDWSGAWDAIKQTVAGVWDAIQGLVGVAVEQIKLTIGVALEIVGSIFKDTWDRIQSGAADGFRWIVGVVQGGVDDIVGFVAGLPGRVAGALAGLWDGLTSGFEAAIDWVRSVWNRFVDFWNGIEMSVPGIDIPLVGTIGGFTVGLPDLPHAATGVRNFQGGLAVVGELGPEIVALPRGADVFTNIESKKMLGPTIHLTVNAPSGDADVIASKVRSVLEVLV